MSAHEESARLRIARATKERRKVELLEKAERLREDSTESDVIEAAIRYASASARLAEVEQEQREKRDVRSWWRDLVGGRP